MAFKGSILSVLDRFYWMATFLDSLYAYLL